MIKPVSINAGVEFYRIRQSRDRNMLNCDSPTWFTGVYTLAGTVCRDKTIRLISNPENMSKGSQIPFLYRICSVCAQILDGHAKLGMVFGVSFWTKNGRLVIPLGIKPTSAEKAAKDVHESFDSVFIGELIQY